MVDDHILRPNRDEMPIHRSRSREARWLNDLVSLERDMQSIDSYLHFLLEHEVDQVLAPAVLAAALIAYRRCFKTGLRAAISNADATSSPHDGGWFHKHLIDMADKLIAHSVNPFEETMSGFMVQDGKVAGVVTLSVQQISFHPDLLKQWGRLVEDLRGKNLHPKINESRAALRALGDSLPIEDVLRAPLLEKDPLTIKADEKRQS